MLMLNLCGDDVIASHQGGDVTTHFLTITVVVYNYVVYDEDIVVYSQHFVVCSLVIVLVSGVVV